MNRQFGNVDMRMVSIGKNRNRGRAADGARVLLWELMDVLDPLGFGLNWRRRQNRTGNAPSERRVRRSEGLGGRWLTTTNGEWCGFSTRVDLLRGWDHSVMSGWVVTNIGMFLSLLGNVT